MTPPLCLSVASFASVPNRCFVHRYLFVPHTALRCAVRWWEQRTAGVLFFFPSHSTIRRIGCTCTAPALHCTALRSPLTLALFDGRCAMPFLRLMSHSVSRLLHVSDAAVSMSDASMRCALTAARPTRLLLSSSPSSPPPILRPPERQKPLILLPNFALCSVVSCCHSVSPALCRFVAFDAYAFACAPPPSVGRRLCGCVADGCVDRERGIHYASLHRGFSRNTTQFFLCSPFSPFGKPACVCDAAGASTRHRVRRRASPSPHNSVLPLG